MGGNGGGGPGVGWGGEGGIILPFQGALVPEETAGTFRLLSEIS